MPFVAHWPINTLRPRQNGRRFADDIFKCIFLNENVWISLKISLKFVPNVRINNIPALVQIMAWRWQGDKPLSEHMMVNLPTHVCVTRPQWINSISCNKTGLSFNSLSNKQTMRSTVRGISNMLICVYVFDVCNRVSYVICLYDITLSSSSGGIVKVFVKAWYIFVVDAIK